MNSQPAVYILMVSNLGKFTDLTEWSDGSSFWWRWLQGYWDSFLLVGHRDDLSGLFQFPLESKWKWKWSHSVVSNSLRPCKTVAHQASPYIWFSRQEYWSGVPLPSPTSWKLVFQFRSVTQSCPTLFDPMNRSTPGLPVHHQLPEFTETHVHPVGDAIQPSHPPSSPFPPAPNPSQHQSFCV